MRDFYDSDEECDNSQEECEEYNEDEEYNVKPKPGNQKDGKSKNGKNSKNAKQVEEGEVKKGFDVDFFDEKVAVTVVDIHRNVRRNREYRAWVRKNSFHLSKMYKLSELKCTQSDFNRYMYESTVH